MLFSSAIAFSLPFPCPFIAFIYYFWFIFALKQDYKIVKDKDYVYSVNT